MTLCSATSTVFSPKSVIQPRKQVALCALQPAGRGASALTPGTPLVLTYLQALKCVCPCAGRNRLCSSHFARRESLLSSCSLSSVSPRSSWICVYLCPFCTESPPTSPAGGAFGSLHPRREPTGLFMPCAFPVDSKTREIKSREKRLARALCGTQAPGCSRSVCPLLAAAGGAEGAEGRKPADACWSLELKEVIRVRLDEYCGYNSAR
ncbi:uncharacterized protein LOC106506082 [Sus scrofa]|uniref:uncharacterized protein LOC106506082 n=1 Tax=Sus scrofa TaxID=9823 RepID=UPI000A2AF578|nr:uncharacterized protein LOC106506082 [Sus scrofa]